MGNQSWLSTVVLGLMRNQWKLTYNPKKVCHACTLKLSQWKTGCIYNHLKVFSGATYSLPPDKNHVVMYGKSSWERRYHGTPNHFREVKRMMLFQGGSSPPTGILQWHYTLLAANSVWYMYPHIFTIIYSQAAVENLLYAPVLEDKTELGL